MLGFLRYPTHKSAIPLHDDHVVSLSVVLLSCEDLAAAPRVASNILPHVLRGNPRTLTNSNTCCRRDPILIDESNVVPRDLPILVVRLQPTAGYGPMHRPLANSLTL